MTKQALADAIAEAERFLERARPVLDAAIKGPEKSEWVYETGPRTAALKRTSLELTRALARMRRAR